MKILVALSVLVFWSAASFGYGPPEYLPDGPRPRIWLTADELARLNAKQAASDPAWTALEAWCDARLNAPGYDQGRLDWNGLDNNGYRMSGYSESLMNFALAYQILRDDNPTKATHYATYVRNILVDGIANGLKAGEEPNGLAGLRCGETTDRTINAAEGTALGISSASYKLGYGARNIMAVPIAYDWIHDTLSAQDKAILSAMMFRWYDWIRGKRSDYNNGVLKNSVRYHEDQDGDCAPPNNCTAVAAAGTRGFDYLAMSGNFMGGFAGLMATIPAATYGDSPDAVIYQVALSTLLSGTMIEQLENALKHSGGDSVEGWNYAGGFHNALQGMYGYHTATGSPFLTQMTWPSSLVKAMLHRSGANLVDVPIWGD